MSLNRRAFLKSTGTAALLAQSGCLGWLVSDGATKDLIERQDKPFNAEPRLDRLTSSFITPYRSFYVRSHGNQADLKPETYALVIEGMVEKPLSLRLEDLEAMPAVTTVATMQCAGNRRSEHSRTKTV